MHYGLSTPQVASIDCQEGVAVVASEIHFNTAAAANTARARAAARLLERCSQVAGSMKRLAREQARGWGGCSRLPHRKAFGTRNHSCESGLTS